MLVVFKGIEDQNVIVFDAEYNEGDLIQFSGIFFKKLKNEIYQISKSINLYVKLEEGHRINHFIEEFTGITDIFLEEKGIDLEEAIDEINDFIKSDEKILFVSHGLYNDRQTLLANGIDFYGKDRDERNPKYRGICTYNLAKKVLKKDGKLKLGDVAEEAGLFLSNGHNSFDDTWATVAVFSFLCKLNMEEE